MQRDIVEQLRNLFVANNWEWALDGGLRVPAEEEIQQTIDYLAKIVIDDGNNFADASTGRLTVQRHYGRLCVLVNMGEIDG